MISLNSVSRIFNGGHNGDEIRALNNVSLSVKEGEFVAITGPSGSGKTTLLFTIGGLLKPSEGEVSVGGVRIYEISSGERASFRRETVGFVFQTFNLIPYLTSIENVALPAVLSGSDRKMTEQRAEELLCRLGLRDRQTHLPTALSVGERQRVALARSIINSPELILADEPTGNLDPACASEVIDFLHEFNRDGKTVILVTHDHALARRTDRVLSLEHGSIQEPMQ